VFIDIIIARHAHILPHCDYHAITLKYLRERVSKLEGHAAVFRDNSGFERV
jgi:hypothetical protein